jgi:hypothetical protein
MYLINAFIMRKVYRNWVHNEPYISGKTIRDRIKNSFRMMLTGKFWSRMLKLSLLPLAFYLYKLDTDPYDNTKKFYLFSL